MEYIKLRKGVGGVTHFQRISQQFPIGSNTTTLNQRDVITGKYLEKLPRAFGNVTDSKL